MVGWSGGGPQDPWHQRLEKKSSRQRQMERSLDSGQGPKRAVMPLVVVDVAPESRDRRMGPEKTEMDG